MKRISNSTLSDETERKRKNNCIRQQKHKEKKLLQYSSLIEDNKRISLQLASLVKENSSLVKENSSLVEENNAIKKELLSRRQSSDLMAKGSSFGKINDSDYAELNSYLSVHNPTISSIITGPVKQKDLLPIDGLSDQAGNIAIKEIASQIFSDSLGRQSDEAINPSSSSYFGSPDSQQAKQTWHVLVDEFAFKPLVSHNSCSSLGGKQTPRLTGCDPTSMLGARFSLQRRKENHFERSSVR
jgi:hypothetical protein